MQIAIINYLADFQAAAALSGSFGLVSTASLHTFT
jgi:hypothetical protein